MFLCAGLLSQTVNVADYFFHKDTEYKTYQWSHEEVDLKEVERTEKRNGQAIQKLTKTLPNGDFSFFTELVYDRDVVRQIAATNPLSGQTEASNRIVLKQPNSTWHYRATFDELKTFTSSMTSVKTEYGVYKDCIAVKEQFSSDNAELKAFEEVFYIRYYAKYRGLVAVHMFDSKTNERLSKERAVAEKEYVDNEIESYYVELAAIQEREKQQKRESEAKRILEKQEASKIYNIQEYDSEMYHDLIDEQREAILAYFHEENKQPYGGSQFPDFKRLWSTSKKTARYTATFELHYKLHPEGKEVNEVGFEVLRSSRDFKTLVKRKHLSGDTNYPVFDRAMINIPYVETSGVKARSEVYFDDLHIDFARGLNQVKVKKGKVKFKSTELDGDLREKLIDKLQNEKKGKYDVEYEIANVMGKETIKTELYKVKKKKGGVWSTVGIVAALGGAYILDIINF